jgi:hypothetical protein
MCVTFPQASSSDPTGKAERGRGGQCKWHKVWDSSGSGLFFPNGRGFTPKLYVLRFLMIPDAGHSSVPKLCTLFEISPRLLRRATVRFLSCALCGSPRSLGRGAGPFLKTINTDSFAVGRRARASGGVLGARRTTRSRPRRQSCCCRCGPTGTRAAAPTRARTRCVF